MTPSNLVLHGGFHRRSGIATVNRALLAGLRRRRENVWMLPDDGPSPEPLPERIDLYLFHGHPWRVQTLGRLNVGLFNYEYPEFRPEDAWLPRELDNRFDRLVAPTAFVADALRRAGLSAPLRVIPWGFDPERFGPPAASPARPFTFVYVGSVNWRKGTDLLLEAFRQEFAGEDVRLVLKEGPREPSWAEWAAALASDDPRVSWQRQDVDCAAPFYQQADCGVFPTRGEGFGLPVLECLACGTPVLVTRGSGCDEFCHDGNSTGLRGPRLDELRAAMRRACQAGSPTAPERERLRSSVAEFAWEATVAKLLDWLPEDPPGGSARGDGIWHCFYEVAATSWRQHAAQVQRAQPEAQALPLGTRWPETAPSLALGQAGFAVRLFGRYPEARKVLYTGGPPPEASWRADDEERRALGAPLPWRDPAEALQARLEWQAADLVLAPSRVSLREAAGLGYPTARARVLPLAFPRALPRPSRGQGPVLFVATHPFRKGLRVLMEAWQLVGARSNLLVLAGSELLRCPEVLRWLVRHPEVELRAPVSHRRLRQLMQTCRCQVLPSREDGFAMTIAEGMAVGLPALVSDVCGIAELLTPGHDSLHFPDGSGAAMAAGLEKLLGGEAERLREAAWETARRRPWAVFRRELRALLESP